MSAYCLAIAGVLLAANAIVWRADRTASDMTLNASNYPAVVPLGGSASTSYECMGTLISTTHILTAAHCFNGDSSGIPACNAGDSTAAGSSTCDSFTSSNYPVTINGVANTMAAVYRNSCFKFSDDGPNSADLAIIELTTPVSGVTPIELYSASDEIGQIFQLMGWGSSGPAGISESQCTSSCTTLYGGRNVFASVAGNTLQYTLSDPSDPSAQSEEAIAWSGDSGGPAFLNNKLVGVNSGGTCCAYGSTDQYVRVSSTLSTNWIQSSMTNNEAADPGVCSEWGNDASTSSIAAEASAFVVTAVVALAMATANLMLQ